MENGTCKTYLCRNKNNYASMSIHCVCSLIWLHCVGMWAWELCVGQMDVQENSIDHALIIMNTEACCNLPLWSLGTPSLSIMNACACTSQCKHYHVRLSCHPIYYNKYVECLARPIICIPKEQVDTCMHATVHGWTIIIIGICVSSTTLTLE